jgi:type I restriction enzyme, S subunit
MTLTRFAEVVSLSSTRIADPASAGIERFVGLEHIEPENLHIRSWGLVADGTTFTSTFKRGQVLFGKRRAYQRKVAVADFDGVCSSDIYVFESKDPNVLLPELLPFICQSEGFFEYAVKTSAGSLSPRTNWAHLANYEFPLPPVDEQRRIADLLWAADDVITEYRELVSKTENLLKSKMREVMQNENWKLEPLEKLAIVERGKFAHRPRNLPKFYGGKYPFVQTGDIARCRGNLTTYEQTLSEEGKAISKSFPIDSIIMTIAAVIGKTAITTFETWTTDSLVGIIPQNIDVHFLEFYLRTQQQHLESVVATQTAQKNINLADLRPMLIPVPPKEEQKAIARQLLEIQNSLELQEQHIEKSLELKKQLLNKNLSA